MTGVASRWSCSSSTRWNGFLHRQTLDPVGFEIVEAEKWHNCAGAFAITMPDIVMLDVRMVGMGGFAVCEGIRAVVAGRNTLIPMATALENVRSIERAYRVGATHDSAALC
jgi:two-component system sensor histidine kinase/response regulator